MFPHPPFCRVTDSEVTVHLVSFPCISRITYTGAEEFPSIELYIQFGGTIILAGQQATDFLTRFERWVHVVN
jgi:hypothetical protein